MNVNGSAPEGHSPPGTPFALSVAGPAGPTGHLTIDPERDWGGDDPPLVSCLMVTRDRPKLAARAVECFLAQSYPNRELVIIDDGDSDELRRGIEAIGYPPIKLHSTVDQRRTLGELRNRAVEESAGRYVCQWDDDDLSDPDRLTVQMSAIISLAVDACFLTREQLWWPARRILAVSTPRMWENTMVCAKEKVPRYRPLRRGEDTVVAYHLWRCARAVMLDEPRLYTYVFHGSNTFGESHFEQHFTAATQQWTGDAYRDRLDLLCTRVPIDTDAPISEPSDV